MLYTDMCVVKGLNIFTTTYVYVTVLLNFIHSSEDTKLTRCLDNQMNFKHFLISSYFDIKICKCIINSIVGFN